MRISFWSETDDRFVAIEAELITIRPTHKDIRVSIGRIGYSPDYGATFSCERLDATAEYVADAMTQSLARWGHLEIESEDGEIIGSVVKTETKPSYYTD